MNGFSKYILTPNQNEILSEILSPRYINDNYVKKTKKTNRYYETMDETDFSPKKSFIISEGGSAEDKKGNVDDEHVLNNGQQRVSSMNGSVRTVGRTRASQAVKRVTEVNGTCTIDLEDEVGQCKISTITLSPGIKTLQRRIEYLSDNQLDKIVGLYGSDDSSSDVDDALDTLTVEGMPTTTSRSQNDLIQFVFTSHGIRVISDKEYVV